jgi:calcium-dependent protein kinase
MGETLQQIFEVIQNGEYEFPPQDWDKISPNAKDFIKRLLVLDYRKRLTAEQCLQHPWLLVLLQQMVFY